MINEPYTRGELESLAMHEQQDEAFDAGRYGEVAAENRRAVLTRDWGADEGPTLEEIELLDALERESQELLAAFKRGFVASGSSTLVLGDIQNPITRAYEIGCKVGWELHGAVACDPEMVPLLDLFGDERDETP